MADNKVVSAAIGVGPTVATDEIAGVDHLRIKVEFGVDGSAVDVSATDPMPVVQTGTPALPTGASTSALQTSTEVLVGAVTETAPATDIASSGLNGRLQRIAQRITSLIALIPTSLGIKTAANSFAVTLPSDGVLPLPTGAATSAIQTTTETLIGAVVETAPVTDTASSGLNGRLQRIAQRITSLIALIPTSLGSKTTANSFAVTLPSDGVLPLPTGAATETSAGAAAASLTLIDDAILADDAAFTPAVTKVMMAGFEFDDVTPDAVNEGDAGAARMSANRNVYTQIRDAAGNERGANVTAANAMSVDASASPTLPLPTGAATEATSLAGNVLTGAVTETAPATDTASSGLNGRLQRIAQRITSLIALMPTSLGIKTAADSFAVTLPSDGTLPLPTGAATEATSLAGNVLTGAVTETAPGTDTASSGLNGRLQRIAQRITSLIALLPASLGTKTAANSLAITPSSDGNFAIGDGTNLVSIATAGADAASNTANRLRAQSLGMGYNGTTVDRLRAGVTGESGAATGYSNVLSATGAVSGASIVSTTGAVEASRVIKASAGTLMSLVGYNAKTSAQFIQIFNSTTVPANGTVPIYVFTVPASSNFSIDVPVTGMPFTTGIAVSNSSTLATKTIGSADCFFTAVIK